MRHYVSVTFSSCAAMPFYKHTTTALGQSFNSGRFVTNPTFEIIPDPNATQKLVQYGKGKLFSKQSAYNKAATERKNFLRT
jgi:hypothetical protein